MTPKSIIEECGGKYIGLIVHEREILVCFNDPETGSTLGILKSELTLESVRKRIAESRKEFKAKEK